VSLQKQASVVFCAAWGHKQSLVPTLIEGIKKKAILKGYKAWRAVLVKYMKAEQSKVKFGTPSSSGATCAFDEFEVDEAVFRKGDIEDNQVQFQEFVGLKRRGDRKSLVLHKRDGDASISSRRADTGGAAPPPMTKLEWGNLRAKHVGRNQNALTHSDGAPAYRIGLQDWVSHSGKDKQYTKNTSHKDSMGNEVKCVAGTQSMDGWWQHGKKAAYGVNARFGSEVDACVRAEQWQHWVGNEDRWVAAGNVVRWFSEAR
jgi:hypothetical protein